MDDKTINSNLPIATNTTTKTLVSSSPIQLYMREIARYPLLSPEEEYRLAVEHVEHKDINAAHRLVTSNLRLVVKIANDFRQAQSNFLDLIQEGNAGLMQAVKKFDPYKGVKLSTYAGWWIRAYILRYIMENKSQVKIGTTSAQRKLFFNLRREAERLLAEYDHVSPKMLAESMDVKESEVVEMQKRLSGADVSLDTPVSDDSPATRGSLIASEIEAIDETLANSEIREVFAEHLAEFKQILRARDLEVFNLRLMAEDPVTLQEIGDRYGISRERARQIEEQIIKKLRKFVVDKGIIDI